MQVEVNAGSQMEKKLDQNSFLGRQTSRSSLCLVWTFWWKDLSASSKKALLDGLKRLLFQSYESMRALQEVSADFHGILLSKWGHASTQSYAAFDKDETGATSLLSP